MPSTLDDVLAGIDLGRLLEARLWVARLGETDVNNWWRIDGILGEAGAFVGPRVLPRTHATGRARIAFAVAAHACQERHPDRQAMHLFKLTPEIEDRFDQQLVDWLARTEFWNPIMEDLEAVKQGDGAGAVLKEAGLVTDEDLAFVNKLKLGPAERSLPVPGSTADEALRRLCAGFVRSTPGTLSVPVLSGGA